MVHSHFKTVELQHLVSYYCIAYVVVVVGVVVHMQPPFVVGVLPCKAVLQ